MNNSPEKKIIDRGRSEIEKRSLEGISNLRPTLQMMEQPAAPSDAAAPQQESSAEQSGGETTNAASE